MHKKHYVQLTKSMIPELFKKRCPTVDPEPFVAAAHVFPMRVNNHVTENLIDWSNIPNDPLFQLSFPQPRMLYPSELSDIIAQMREPGVTKVTMQNISESVRARLNPHPAGQKEENVPRVDGVKMPGMQHKYRETVLFFPSEGQFCHAFCTYCFRWAQFTSVGSGQTFKSNNASQLQRYIQTHKEVKDVLITGGDPMVATADTLRSYIQPLLSSDNLEHLATIRIGTKSLAWWPYRYLLDPDAKDVLNLFSEVVASGKQLAIQAHFSHPRELEVPATQEAIRLIRQTGAQIRCQGPLIRNINNASETWAHMWSLQVRLGLIPYYMFVERDTGARDYFSVPLAEAFKIYSGAYSRLPGTARTARGPSMSAGPGKVAVVGDTVVAGERVFALKFLQARNPNWCDEIFFAKWSPDATWLTDLKPAFGQDKFFFEDEYSDIAMRVDEGSSGQLSALM
ncbi:hypothetical protein AARAC_005167 [Aspergillus arachidicola]|uniref:Lysine 2,3-aminomutase n=1 Tax=Aspergillus arachidicola TaxID=656916 RepID=A0A2G7FH96_9EURO|nr:hypothetical protein AARAC_005167 [Aspergillus arachidicola]